MIQFRPFRNTDPPALVEVWNEAFPNRGSFPQKTTAFFELCVYSKPYFDPNGLIVAEDEGKIVGFAHAGFGPNAAENCLAADAGIICTIAVRLSHRRRGIGRELVRRCEEYLDEHGVSQFTAGALRPLNPFYFGLYGGADSPGILDSDTAAAPFLEHCGYVRHTVTQILHCALVKYESPVDPRFLSLRRRYDTQLNPAPVISSWWQECVMGCFEPVEFRLMDKLSGIPAARVLAWEMSSGRQAGMLAAGILDIQVRPEVRRQGLAKFLLNQMIRYVMEQNFKLMEVHVPEANAPARGLFNLLGFSQVDTGATYRRNANGSPVMLPTSPA